MNNQIILRLKKKLADLAEYGGMDVETQRNALKEELQFYVLNFIYHHPDYNEWIMYGGSALRICHDLDRMSVDLDFEVASLISDEFLAALKKDLAAHFKETYSFDSDLLSIKITAGRGLILRFNLGAELEINHPSKQVHVKIDLNYFKALNAGLERCPINHNQLSFVIKTYNMSTLMASKIAAIFLRGKRGVGKEVFAEKGRDIYDLIWYMTKKIVPDFNYLIAKGIDLKDPRPLFDQLTLQMNKVSDTNLKQDLSPLFTNQVFIENWLQGWRESYFHLLAEYQINTITDLKKIIVNEDFQTDNFSFTFFYNTAAGIIVRVIYEVVYEWLESEKDLGVEINEEVIKLVVFEPGKELSSQLKQFITLFHKKTEKYFKKTNQLIFGNIINTKLIRTTALNFNQSEQIVLSKSVLRSCELDDLLK